MSKATTLLAPNLAAAIESMADPQPKSKTCESGVIKVSANSRHIFVVGWCPVPKAKPGSNLIIILEPSL